MPPFGAPMDRQRRIVELPAHRLVEVRVVLGRDLALRLGPDGGAVPDAAGLFRFAVLGLHDEVDRYRHCAAVLAHDAFDGVALGEVLAALVEVEDHPRAAHGRVAAGRLDGVGALPIGGPEPGFALARLAGEHVHAPRHHEGGVEPDAELADEARAVALVAELLQERPRARSRDGAQRLGEVVAAHADAVVRHGKGLRLGIGGKRNAQIGVVAEQRLVLQCERAQFFTGVGGIGHQFAQEDVAVRIDRVNHQMKQTRDVCLERTALGRLVRFGCIACVGLAALGRLVRQFCRCHGRPRLACGPGRPRLVGIVERGEAARLRSRPRYRGRCAGFQGCPGILPCRSVLYPWFPDGNCRGRVAPPKRKGRRKPTLRVL